MHWFYVSSITILGALHYFNADCENGRSKAVLKSKTRNTGRRSGAIPDPVPPALSPPAAPLPSDGNVCVRLAVLPCDSSNDAQRWFVSVDADGKPVMEKPTSVRSAVYTNATMRSCWRAQFQRQQPANTCALHNAHVLCEDDIACTSVPPTRSHLSTHQRLSRGTTDDVDINKDRGHQSTPDMHARGLPSGCDRAGA